MKIGVISDTHDDFKSTKRACEVFRSRKVDMIIHAGDFTSPEIIDLFKDFNCRFVYGNADIDVNILNKECADIGFDCLRETCDLDIEGKKFFLMHGDDISTFRDAVASGKYDYIIKGHTHHFENYIRNNTRIINPGSLSKTNENTIAILDTVKDVVEKIIL